MNVFEMILLTPRLARPTLRKSLVADERVASENTRPWRIAVTRRSVCLPQRAHAVRPQQLPSLPELKERTHGHRLLRAAQQAPRHPSDPPAVARNWRRYSRRDR